MKNEYEIRGETVALFVKCKGETLEALISLSDLEKVKSFPFTWYAYYNKRRNVFIVVGNFQPTNEGRKRILLSRWIMDPKGNLVVDHMNHNTLDNQRDNLRILTNGENQQNRVKFDRNGSRRGVYKRKDTNVWMAYMTINNRRIYIGQFCAEEEADKAVEAYRKEHMPYCPENLMEG